MVDKVDNISVGQFYTEDYLKNSGLITSVSFNRLYATKIRADKTAQDVGVINNGVSDVSSVFEIIDIATATSGFANASIAGISLNPTIPELDRTVTLVGTPDPTSVNIQHIELPDIPDLFGGNILTPNADGTITVNQDVLAFQVTCMAVTEYGLNDNIVLGIGIGDPSDLPDGAGKITVGGTYVSRFRDAQKGAGSNRTVTLQTPYFPVGKTRTLGATAGDRIFVVMWTEEAANISVIVDDMIFAVQAIPL